MSDAEFILRAAHYATQKHGTQTRKGSGLPYIEHPVGVASILATEFGITDGNVIAAGLLHDVIEDCYAADQTMDGLVEIRKRFGVRVAEIVREVSDDRKLTKEERKRDRIAHAASISKEACLVKMADMTHNLRDRANALLPGETKEGNIGYFLWCRACLLNMRNADTKLQEKLLAFIDSYLATAHSEHPAWFQAAETRMRDEVTESVNKFLLAAPLPADNEVRVSQADLMQTKLVPFLRDICSARFNLPPLLDDATRAKLLEEYLQSCKKAD